MLKSWQTQATRLKFQFEGSQLPKHLSIAQALELFFRDRNYDETQQIYLRRFLANRRIKMVTDLLTKHNQWQKRNPGPVVLLTELWTTNWNERNAQVYLHFLGQLPSWVILKNTSTHLKLMLEASTSSRKTRQLQKLVDELEFILRPWASHKIPEMMNGNDNNDYKGNQWVLQPSS